MNINGKIAFGPMVGLPSSDWVGKDIADYLLKNGAEVSKFSDFSTYIEADYIILVKVFPSMGWFIDKVSRGIKILYAPVDVFHSRHIFLRYRTRLKLCSGFLIHNDRVGRLLSTVSDSPQFFIEHYLKYKLPSSGTRAKNNELLWIGHLEYVPSLIQYLMDNNLPLNIRALTDLEKLPFYDNYLSTSLAALGVEYEVSKNNDERNGIYISGFYFEQWSEDRQEELMQSCVAAFDTKMDSFAHKLKPPTKAQKYIYNRIPFACSEFSYSFEYFNKRGLKLAKLDDFDYLLSSEYKKAIGNYCELEKWRVDIKNVANTYLLACENSVRPKRSFHYFEKTKSSIDLLIYLCEKTRNKLTVYFKGL